MFRNKSASVHQFAMVPRADIPRSAFRIESAYKTTFDAGWLIPVYCEEVLPGDTFNLRATMFARLATPIVPIIDNLYLESFFFFVPNRLLWSNWKKFMGEQESLGDTIDYLVPQVTAPSGGFVEKTLGDYFGLPTVGQAGTGTFTVNVMPFRAYNLIFNEWFRDENMVTHATRSYGDGPDPLSYYQLRRRGKRHDYFTACLPWVQKGASVQLPLGTSAPIVGTGFPTFNYNSQERSLWAVSGGAEIQFGNAGGTAQSTPTTTGVGIWNKTGLEADLSAATAATINQIRQAFQIQKLLERDARGGTRYTEIVRSHFGVVSPDARLQRPEYLGGGMTPVSIHPVAQTSGTATDETGYTPTPAGSLSAYGTAVAKGHGFTQSFTEHGWVLGLINVRADLTYQQGLRKHWSRSTRYDYYFPVFAMLGEQAVLNKEIYFKNDTNDNNVFGYQERWAEYRYQPSTITGLMRSTHAQPLDIWHLAQHFTSLPTLNETFISDNPPIDRIVATTEQTGQQFLIDILFRNKAARPLPMYSVPGLVDHF